LDLPSRTYCAIFISVNEAISNALIHGNKFDLDKKVSLFIQLKGNKWICFTVKDEGSGFDFENILNTTHSEYKTKSHGNGLFFMKKMATLTFFFEKGTNVELHFKLNSI